MKSKPMPLICDECGKQMEPFTLPAAHNCDGGEALRKAAHELFAPTVDLIERTIAKAGTGVLRGVFEVAAERDRLRASYKKLIAALEAQEQAELHQANCPECMHTTRDWSCCESCSKPFGLAIELRREALAVKVQS